MTPLCRHLLAAGHPCSQPAVNGSHYCRHHGLVKRHTSRRPRNPNDFTFTMPFVYPEDRAAIQFNLNLVMQALNDHRIDAKTANSFNNLLRSCRLNLGKTPLLDPDAKHAVQQVILTPEGDEIAPPRAALEEGESPLHDKNCLCPRCAEEFRNAPPEQHHADCKCGLCDEPSDQPSTNGCHPERSETKLSEVEEPALSMPKGPAFSRPTHNNGCPTSRRDVGGENLDQPAKRVSLDAPSLHSYELPDSTNQEINLINEIYREAIEKYKADSTALAQAAVDAGLEPPRAT